VDRRGSVSDVRGRGFPYADRMAERNLHLHATVTRDGDWYVARCLEVEVTSQGETIESALANLRETLELYFEDEPFPAVTPSPIVAPVDISIPA
jgi:predicted RNase H-like HicB family nuclease